MLNYGAPYILSRFDKIASSNIMIFMIFCCVSIFNIRLAHAEDSKHKLINMYGIQLSDLIFNRAIQTPNSSSQFLFYQMDVRNVQTANMKIEPLIIYMGLNLGDSRRSVLSKKGKPDCVNSTTNPGGMVGKNENCTISHLDMFEIESSYDHFVYQINETDPNYPLGDTLDVLFNQKRDRVISIKCSPHRISFHFCPTVFGIRAGQTEEYARKILGPPDSELVLPSLARFMIYRRYNLTLQMEKEIIYRFTIGNFDEWWNYMHINVKRSD